jgi:hypothetical protein
VSFPGTEAVATDIVRYRSSAGRHRRLVWIIRRFGRRPSGDLFAPIERRLPGRIVSTAPRSFPQDDLAGVCSCEGDFETGIGFRRLGGSCDRPSTGHRSVEWTRRATLRLGKLRPTTVPCATSAETVEPLFFRRKPGEVGGRSNPTRFQARPPRAGAFSMFSPKCLSHQLCKLLILRGKPRRYGLPGLVRGGCSAVPFRRTADMSD